MAIYHLSVKAISRSGGRSATAAIAYRSGERVVDMRTGLVHDYTRRRGVEHTEIFLPENSPEWATQREALWNAAELAETRKNSTVAREFEVALPAELDAGQRLALVREFAGELVVRHGMAVDVAIHEPGREGDNRNHHAHILCSTRRLTPDGFADKTRELDNQRSGEIDGWRERWAAMANRYLERAGRQERIDHRSLAAQQAAAIERGDTQQAAQLERVPTVHLGPNVVQMEQRGIRTERGEQHREITQRNAQIIDLAEARQRLAAARADYERRNENGRDRAANRVAERSAARPGSEQPGRGASQPDLSRLARVPPPFARGHLRNLSELGVVRFPGRGEVLLPRDVSGDMEHKRAKPDHAMRRGDDGLTVERSATPRELIQRDLNARLLRQAVAEREPAKAMNDPSPEAIKREWRNEKARQFRAVATRAEAAHGRASAQMARQDDKLRTHDQARPVEPVGLFAGMKRAAHDQALAAWRGVRAGLERRWVQLQARVRLIGDYMRQAGPYEQPTRGERLAERLATQAKPELAASFARITEREKAERVAAQRAKIEQRLQRRRQGKQPQERQERTMDAQQKRDVDRTAGNEAGNVAKALGGGQERDGVEKTKEERAAEILKKFREKKAREREEKDRGGRGR